MVLRQASARARWGVVQGRGLTGVSIGCVVKVVGLGRLICIRVVAGGVVDCASFGVARVVGLIKSEATGEHLRTVERQKIDAVKLTFSCLLRFELTENFLPQSSL